MSINLYNLELTLAKLMASAATTNELLSYSKAIKNAKTGSVITVPTFADLPSAVTTPAGSLYFVESDRAFYLPYNDYGIWYRLTADTVSTVFTWGCNGYGRLGDNTIVNKSSPVSVVGG
jgi:alpha-tubulin suppressor-like RCC1 family protein